MTQPSAGHVDVLFAPVRAAFDELLASGAESGAALAVTHQGRLVIDLVGGRRGGPADATWTADTLVNTYSVAKPVAALCVLLLHDRGLLGLDDPIARHWPEFAVAGKGKATVRHALAHTAGLPIFPVPRTAADLADWALLAGDLAAAAPLWEPGTAAAEHALTYGHLAGELVRRIDGRPIGRFLAEEIAAPWRLDLGFGLSPADQARAADLEYADPDWPTRILGEPGSLRARGLGNPAGALQLDVLNSPLWRRAELPAVNLHATATGLARLYAGLLAGGVLDGVRLFSENTVSELARVQYAGPDLLLGNPVRWGLGMQIDEDGSWGMGGIGGNLAYADPARGYTLAYVTRRLGGFDRVDALTEALHSCL
ncbi:serine hydrolase domain-containing protein [Micromonospora sp. NPDC049679]|uniref:serine hydrolase domain-containing protein n=1 Tax=Micromonospora sp. NPDC049679 TaxID=3155920 RepID=UPI0033FBB8C4